jgi:hypothetical protein
MKIYIIHTEILPDDKHFHELTNKEVVAMCNDAFWNKTYFAMLANAWKVCKAIKEDKPC